MVDRYDNMSIEWIEPKQCAVMIRWEEHCPNLPKHINSGVELQKNGIDRRIYFWVCCEHYSPSLREEQMVTIFG